MTVRNDLDPIVLDMGAAADYVQVFHSTNTSFRAEVVGEALQIDIHDQIGTGGVRGADIEKAIRAYKGGQIDVSLNTPGGNYFEGVQIYNSLLKSKAAVDVTVSGLAASAGSLVAMAGDSVTMSEGAFIMVHRSSGAVLGNSNEMRETASLLDKVDGAQAKILNSRLKLGETAVMALLDATTWFDGEQSVKAGLADNLTAKPDTPDSQPVTMYELSGFTNTPEEVTVRYGKQDFTPKTPRDVEKMLMRDAGYSRSEARAVMGAVKDTVESTQDAAGQKSLVAALEDAISKIGKVQ